MATPAGGQSSPPRSGTGGEVERRLPPAATPRGDIPATPGLPPPPAPSTRPEAFVLLGVDIVGMTVFDPGDFVADYEALLGRRVGAAELEALAAGIAERYRRAGYALVTSVVPPQNGAHGIARVEVIEGHVERLIVEGPPSAAASPLLQAFGARLAAERPLRRSTLERNLLLIGDLPGAELGALRLRPIELAAGRFELVAPLRFRTTQFAVALDNRGTRDYGPWQLWTSARVNGLEGHAAWSAQAAIFTAPARPREILYGQAAVTRTLGPRGTTLRALVSGSRNEAGGPLADVDARTDSRRLAVTLGHAVLRSRGASLWITATADALRATEERGDRRFFADELRVLRAGLTGLLGGGDDADDSTRATLETSLGLDVLGASSAGPARSRPAADARFATLRADLVHARRLVGPLWIELRAGGQIADGAVFTAEEFELGGARFGRAFEPGVLSGDRAVAGGVELRHVGPPRPPWLDRLEFLAFADGGASWVSGERGRVRDHLASAGIGLRARFGAGWRAGLELGHPLGSSVAKLRDQGPRLYFSLAAEF